MATTIKLKNSVTTTNAPSSLEQGEVAINVTDKKVWVGNAATSPVQLLGTGASATFTDLTVVNGASIQGLTVGRGAGAISTNTAVGSSALAANTTGSNNTAFGVQSLNSNTTASNNTAVGYQAAYTNSTGVDLVAVGAYALTANTTGGQNIGIGFNALSGNTTGSFNTAIGSGEAGSNRGALGYNTTGSNNTAVGFQALISNSTAGSNTAVGYQAGYSNTTGVENTFIGQVAGYSNLTGSSNVFIGRAAGYFTTGSNNTFVGSRGTGTGDGAGYAITTGSKNTIIGQYGGNQGGLDIRTASNYIVLSDGDGNPRGIFNPSGFFKAAGNGTLGYSVAVTNHEIAQGTTNTDTLVVTNSHNATPYGVYVKFSGATPNNTNNYFLACEDSTNLKAIIYSNGTISNRTGTYNTISDAKLKENIVDATSKLDKLMQTRVVNYNLIGDELKQIGFVAQELEQVFPSLVDNVPDLDENKEPTGEITKGVKLTVMIPILVKAIQELKAEVDSLKQQINGV